jgi:hypothetical protein
MSMVIGFVLVTSNCNSSEDGSFDYESFFRLGYPQSRPLADWQNLPTHDHYSLGRGQDIVPFDNSDIPLIMTSASHEEVPTVSDLLALSEIRKAHTGVDPADQREVVHSTNNVFTPERQFPTTLSPESARLYLKPRTVVGVDGRGKHPDPTSSSQLDSIIKPPYSWHRPPLHHFQVGSSHLRKTPSYDTSSTATSALCHSHEILSQSDPVKLNASPETSKTSKKSQQETPIWVSKTQKMFNSEGRTFIYWFTSNCKTKHTAQFPSDIVITDNNWRSQYEDERTYEVDTLGFHKRVFTNYNKYTGEIFYSRIMSLIDRISQEGVLREKLIMTEDQFIEHSLDINRVASNEETIINSKKNKNPDQHASRKRTQKAYRQLVIERRHWYNYWNKHLKGGYKNIIATIELIKPAKMRDTTITFFAFVMMIEKIVPRGGYQEQNVGLLLEEALEIMNQIFNPEFKNASGESMKLFRNGILGHIFLSSSSTRVMPAFWKMIELWMKTFRKEFLVKINDKRKSLHSTKFFFNTIFVYSIEALNREIRNC